MENYVVFLLLPEGIWDPDEHGRAVVDVGHDHVHSRRGHLKLAQKIKKQ